MRQIRSVCVFCGSSVGADPAHREAGFQLGRLLAENELTLVYGGGHVGLMGVIADAALSAGGKVVGVIPQFLCDVERGHGSVTDLIVVDSMHERKARMFEAADAFAIMPGGLGTLDETFEILTWKQLALHDKPIVIVDNGGYWRPCRALVESVVAGGFARPEILELMTVVDSVDGLLPALKAAPQPHPSAPAERL